MYHDRFHMDKCLLLLKAQHRKKERETVILTGIYAVASENYMASAAPWKLSSPLLQLRYHYSRLRDRKMAGEKKILKVIRCN